MDYIFKILRTLFFRIDQVVYEGIGNVYDLLLSIARTSIFNSDTIEGFYDKIYAFIGIFMLFKISFSLITYVLNPDDFSDKDKGFASIAKRVVLSLVMLVLVPYGFQEAYELQTIILEDNTLAALIFNDVDNDEEATYKIDTAGDKIKFILMYTFFQPNYNEIMEEVGDPALSACAVTYEHESNGAIKVENGIFVLNSDCFGEKKGDLYSTTSSLAFYWDDKDLYQTYAQGVARQNFYLMFKHNIAMLQLNGKEIYVIDYMSPISTAVGIIALWVLLMFCVDVAVRSVKLGFFELIAPIPILSYIDPKSKDGMLSKWFKQVSTTYLSLFLRLLALYLAIFIIHQVCQNGIADVVTGERITDWWVIIFIIIGVLMFAKQLPKILEDALGIKGTGDFTLNPLKKMEKDMLGGKALAKGARFGLGAAAGVGTAALVGGAGLLTGQGLRWGAMGKAIAGGARGEKFGKNFASSYGAGRARKKQLDQMRADGVTPGQVRAAKLYNAFHGETRAEQVSTLENQAKAIQSYYDTIKGQAVSCDSNDGTSFVSATTGRNIRSAKTISKELDELKKTTINRADYSSDADYQAAIAAQKDRIKAAEGDLEERINWLAQGNSTGVASANKVISEATAAMQSLVAKSNDLGTSLDSDFVTITATGTDVVGMMKQAKGTAAQANSGRMSDIKDVGKYADGSKK